MPRSRTTVNFELVDKRLVHWTETGALPAAAYCAGTREAMFPASFFGRRAPGDTVPLSGDSLFLVASLTKPVTVTAALILLERGEIALDDPIVEFLPAFAGSDRTRSDVRVRHLMTHTSGLPDQLPQNTALRAAHAPLSTFVEEACRTPLLFAPGTQVRYQSMGTALLGEIVRVVSGKPLPEFLREEVFEPLGMTETSLGWRPETADGIAKLRLEPEQAATDWHWNTPYWLGFGAPWGGLITSPADFARFCRMMLLGGALDGVRILSAATVCAMTRNQLDAFPSIPEEDRRCRPWGLGWRLNWRGTSAFFGDLLGPKSYGHWGATGTLCWIDPDPGTFLVLLTTLPPGEDGRYLARISNMIAAALN